MYPQRGGGKTTDATRRTTDRRVHGLGSGLIVSADRSFELIGFRAAHVEFHVYQWERSNYLLAIVSTITNRRRNGPTSKL